MVNMRARHYIKNWLKYKDLTTHFNIYSFYLIVTIIPVLYFIQLGGWITWLISPVLLYLLMRFYGKRRSFVGLMLFIFAGLMNFLNLLYGVSLLFQGEGFNDRFFFHISIDSIGVALSAFSWHLAFFVLFFGIIIITPLFFEQARKYSTFGGFLLFAASISSSVPVYSLIDYLSEEKVSDKSIVNIKVLDSTLVAQDPGSLKNIIFLYAESLERSYSNKALFGQDLTPNLTQLETEALNFTNLKQVSGTGWTMGSIVSSQCGRPMPSSFGVNSLFSTIKNPLPDTTCMGDILASQGYSVEFIGGASLDFAGKGNFLETHGYTKVMGLNELSKMLPDNAGLSDWGVYDEHLFDLAIKRIHQLEQSDSPYAMTLLTLDTHHPDGYPSPDCNLEDSFEFESVILCSDGKISKFIKELRTKYPNTIVALMSDHLSMRNGLHEKLISANESRRLRFSIWSDSVVPRVISTEGFHFDVAPTLLGLVGIKNLGILNLGSSLINQRELIADTKQKMIDYLNEPNLFQKFDGPISFNVDDYKPKILVDGQEIVATNEGLPLDNSIFAIEIDLNRKPIRIIDSDDYRDFFSEVGDLSLIGVSSNRDFNFKLGVNEDIPFAFFIGNIKHGKLLSGSIKGERLITTEEIEPFFSPTTIYGTSLSYDQHLYGDMVVLKVNDEVAAQHISNVRVIDDSFLMESGCEIMGVGIYSQLYAENSSIRAGLSEFDKDEFICLDGLDGPDAESINTSLKEVYQYILGRAADKEGLHHYASALVDGSKSAFNVITELYNSEEYLVRLTNP